MAFAKGGLAVPLKTFTIQLFAWSNGNPPLSRAKCAGTLTTVRLRARGISKLVGIGNNQHPTSNTQHPRHAPNAKHWMFDVGCWWLDVRLFPLFPHPLNRCLTGFCASVFINA